MVRARALDAVAIAGSALPAVGLADLPQWHASAALVDRHVRLYTPEEVTTLLTEAGFSDIAIDRTGAPRYHWRATV